LLAGFRKFNRFKGRTVAKKKVAAPKKVESKPGPVVKTVKAVVENVLGEKGKARRTKRRAAVKKVVETIVETIKHPVVAVENVLGDKGKARRTKRRAAVKEVAAKVKAKLTPAPKAVAPAKPAAAMKPAKKAAKK